MLLSSIALFLAVILFFVGILPSLAMAQQQQQTTTTTTSPPLPSLSITTIPPLTPEEQEQQNRLQSVIAATNQNLDEAEKQVGGVVYTPRWSEPVWIEPDSLAVLIAYCLPGEFAESGQEILGGFELEVLESYEVALPPDFMAWMMVIGNEDRQNRLPAAVGVICASDLNDAQTRVLSPEEQQQINNVVQQFTQVTDIDQVINIINNVTTTTPPPNGNTTTTPTPTTSTTMPPGNNNNTTKSTGGGADTTPPVLTVPDDMVVETTQSFATILFTVTASDDVDGTATLDDENNLIQDNVGGSITITCGKTSGSNFQVGEFGGFQEVECYATDQAGNQGAAQFTVRVVNPPPPPAGPTLAEEEPPVEEQPPPEEEPAAEEEAATTPPVGNAG
jgi:HYR domain-containing protein